MNASIKSAWLMSALCALMAAGCSCSSPQNHVTVPNKDFPFSFCHEPYINPRIVRDLSGWISDSGDMVVSINLLKSQASNRYSGDVRVREVDGRNPFISAPVVDSSDGEPLDREEFGYQYVGVTSSGIHVLLTSDWSGGTGVFMNLMLVRLEYDTSIQCDWNKGVIRSEGKRLLIKMVGEIPLGDRWDGKLRVDGNKIFVGKDEGWFTTSGGSGVSWLADDPKDRVLEITLDQ